MTTISIIFYVIQNGFFCCYCSHYVNSVTFIITVVSKVCKDKASRIYHRDYYKKVSAAAL